MSILFLLVTVLPVTLTVFIIISFFCFLHKLFTRTAC